MAPAMLAVPVAPVVEAQDRYAAAIIPVALVAPKAGGLTTDGAVRNLVVGLARLDVAAAAIAFLAVTGLAVEALVVGMVGIGGQRDVSPEVAVVVRRVLAANPEAHLERPVPDAMPLADQLGAHDQLQEPLRLLERKEAQGVADHRGDAAVLPAQAVEEHREQQRAVERLRLAAARQEVEQADAVLVEKKVVVLSPLVHPVPPKPVACVAGQIEDQQVWDTRDRAEVDAEALTGADRVEEERRLRWIVALARAPLLGDVGLGASPPQESAV
ncbi:hypothetical protein NKI59_22630 [Mesorhizobium sp. M0598]|uniref:hypothetical protein n=1 Tax=Mesorhizobium sp. M0598 TaxID=2956968 RepID=UPI00333B36B2